VVVRGVDVVFDEGGDGDVRGDGDGVFGHEVTDGFVFELFSDEELVARGGGGAAEEPAEDDKPHAGDEIAGEGGEDTEEDEEVAKAGAEA